MLESQPWAIQPVTADIEHPVVASAIVFLRGTGGKFYQLTKSGLQAGVAASGTKVWKDKDLN